MIQGRVSSKYFAFENVNTLIFTTWFVIVKHQKELDQPGKFHRIKHFPNESKLTEVDHEPGFLLGDSFQREMFHD